LKATRHNGRSGIHGTYNPKHNDREFDIKNSEHISEENARKNVYWDYYQGYCLPGSHDERKLNFTEVERAFYNAHYSAHVDAQNKRNEIARHPERNRTIDDVLLNNKTCPEETLLQLGNIDSTVPADVLAKIAAEYFEEFERKFGSNIHILDWALHLDETTPHIHERHVFDATNQYGEIMPMQEKALEELGFELPDPDKPKGRYNNRKMSFDAECRKMFLDICNTHGLNIDIEPVYGGKSYLEKADYIVEKLKEENERLTKENDALKFKNDNLVLKISDVEKLIDEVSDKAYDSACEVIADEVHKETHNATITAIRDFKKGTIESYKVLPMKPFIEKALDGLITSLEKSFIKVRNSIKRNLIDTHTKKKHVEKIKSSTKESILENLKRFKAKADSTPNKAHERRKDLER